MLKLISDFLTSTDCDEEAARQRVITGFLLRHALQNTYYANKSVAQILQETTVCIFRFPASGDARELERRYWDAMNRQFSAASADNDFKKEAEKVLTRLQDRLKKYQRVKTREEEKAKQPTLFEKKGDAR